MVTALTIPSLGIIFLLLGFIPISHAQTTTNTIAITVNANPLVYHLSSSDPWKASIGVNFSY
jgi:hypothetical protein